MADNMNEEVANKIIKGVYKRGASNYKFYLLSIIFLIISISCLAQGVYYLKYSYFEFNPKPPFIPVDGDNRIYEEVPLSEPIMTSAKRKQWLTDFLFEYYDYNYINYKKHSNDIKEYFYDKVYNSVVAPFFSDSFDIRTLVDKRGIVQAIRVDPMVLEMKSEEGAMISGRRAFKYSTTVRIITYYGDGKNIPETKRVELIVVRESLDNSSSGLIISNFLVVDDE